MNLLDQGEKRLICQILFLQYLTKALLAEGLCVEKLVSAAGGGRQRDQDVWLFESKNFTDGIGAGPGNHQIGNGKQIL